MYEFLKIVINSIKEKLCKYPKDENFIGFPVGTSDK